jgi:hypothetical protein
MHESEYNLPGYTLFSVNINADSHRGIIIYINSSLAASHYDVSNNFSEYLCVQIKCSTSCTLTVCAVYRSPGSNAENDRNLYELITMLSNQVSGKLLLVGDFNFRSINWTNWSVEGSARAHTPAHKFLSSLRDNYLIQHMQDPTRARGTQTPSLLDLVITNEDFVEYLFNLSPLGKSDHSVLQFYCNILVSNACNVFKLNYSEGDYNGLRDYFSSNLALCDLSNYNVCDTKSKEILAIHKIQDLL